MGRMHGWTVWKVNMRIYLQEKNWKWIRYGWILISTDGAWKNRNLMKKAMSFLETGWDWSFRIERSQILHKIISTHLLLLWRWFCLVSYSPVTLYLQGIYGFWKFVAVHQKSSFFRNLGSKLASDSTPERKIKYFIDYGTYTFGVPFLFPVVQKWTAFFIPKIERRKKKYE